MKKTLIIPLLLLSAAFPLSAEHAVAADRKAEMAIVYRKTAEPQKQLYDHVFRRYNTPDLAAQELAEHLRKITLAPFRIMEESEWDGKQPAFLVGDTAFAEKSGIDFKKLGREEWFYKSAGPHILIGGGTCWGNSIAVAKFLENELGCRWFTYESEYLPVRMSLTLPELNRSGTPAFESRVIYIPPDGSGSKFISKRMYRWMRLNRSNFQCEPGIPSRQYMGTHSFYVFVNPDLYFKTHPEYFSMDSSGKRFCGSAKSRMGGQPCLSNPEVAKIAEKKLREFIAADRKNCPPELYPTVYQISQCDNTKFLCLCPECRKITEREGSEAGLLLHFLNPIARSIAKDYPEIRIISYAYVSTEKAPKTIRPEKNVDLQWCDLYFNSDCYHPLTHKFNRGQFQNLTGWNGSIAAVWDYWNMGGRWINPPRIETMASAIAPDIRLFHKLGVRRFFTEAEHRYCDVDTNFIELQWYLGFQLLDDPSRDEKVLIAEFMKHHYGPAEKEMAQAFSIISKAVESEPVPVRYVGSFYQKFLTPAFVKTLYTLLGQAVSRTPADSPYRFRVEQEMLPVLRTMVYYDGFRCGHSRASLLKEYAEMRQRQLEYRYSGDELQWAEKGMKDELAKLSFDFPTPEKFADLPPESIRKFTAADFTKRTAVDDPGSKLGKVIRIGSQNRSDDLRKHASAPEKGMNKFIFGITDMSRKNERWFNLKPELSADEKYHWHCIRDFTFGSKTVFWAWGWWVMLDISKVYLDGAENRWDVWFSVKVTGPAYVPGSKQENDFFIESVILTKPGAVK